jgi:hydroxymethylpyrimidine pyrophosphatase-like HAD family hydrolase
MRRRYLFFDIDRTLTAGGYGESYVPESTKRALRKLRDAGHFLSLATGRSEAMARGYLKDLGFENMVSDGGAGITLDGRLIGIDPLPKDKVVRLIRECEANGLAWGIQPDNTCRRVVPDGRFAAETNDLYMPSRVVPGLDPADCPVIYKAYIACTREQERRLETLPALPHYRFFDAYLFVEPIDKAVGIRRMMRLLGADTADVVVFGDAENDLSMFTGEWTGVAMGNAIDALKARADYVTSDVARDGIYNACAALGLFGAE